MSRHPELDFFNSLSGSLEIVLTRPLKRIGKLLNEAAPPSAKIRSLRLRLGVPVEGSMDTRRLTRAELASIAFRGARIRLRSGVSEGPALVMPAPNGEWFTVADLIGTIEEVERRSRGASEWFGGIDVHHVYFEGIHPDGRARWATEWGS